MAFRKPLPAFAVRESSLTLCPSGELSRPLPHGRPVPPYAARESSPAFCRVGELSRPLALGGALPPFAALECSPGLCRPGGALPPFAAWASSPALCQLREALSPFNARLSLGRAPPALCLVGELSRPLPSGSATPPAASRESPSALCRSGELLPFAARLPLGRTLRYNVFSFLFNITFFTFLFNLTLITFLISLTFFDFLFSQRAGGRESSPERQRAGQFAQGRRAAKGGRAPPLPLQIGRALLPFAAREISPARWVPGGREGAGWGRSDYEGARPGWRRREKGRCERRRNSVCVFVICLTNQM